MCKQLRELMKNCEGTGLVAREVNSDMIKIENKRYVKDVWLVVKKGKTLVILHSNKGKKTQFHKQNEININDYKKIIKNILRHDEYTFKFRGAKKMNLVDRLLYNKDYIGR